VTDVYLLQRESRVKQYVVPMRKQTGVNKTVQFDDKLEQFKDQPM